MFRRSIRAVAFFAVAIGSLLVAAAQQPAHALVGINTCGPFINSTLRLENIATSTSSTVFVEVPNAFVNNVQVPANQTRCIKVLFTAEATCRGPSTVNDQCFIRATIDGAEMHPQGASNQVFLSEDATPNAHAYEWAVRAGAGTHRIAIQRRVGNASTVFTLDDWTLDVMLLN